MYTILGQNDSDSTAIEEFAISTPSNSGSSKKPSRAYADDSEMNSPKELIKPGDICNWLSLGSDRYSATGKVQSTLPPGMYEINNTQNGLIYQKINVVTDNIFKLADSTSEKVVGSIENFWNSKDKFKKFGVLYKRGVVLYGPPGSGKSISIMMIAHNVISRGGIVIMTKHPSLSIQGLAEIRKVQPNIPMVNVFEDIDALIDNFGESDLLSLLDGENQIDNVVNIASTNYPEKLDNRFKNRPSRFDEIYKVDMPDNTTRRNYLESITNGKLDPHFISENIQKWVEDTQGFSIAHLREMVIGVNCLGGEYELVLKRLKAMMKMKASSIDDKKEVGFDGNR